MEHFDSGQPLRILRLVPQYGDNIDKPEPLKRGDIVRFVMRQKSSVGDTYAVTRANKTYVLVREDFENSEGK